jgi:4-alpha-glucanotransferase
MRGSGVILHISSLPSPYGIGTLGNEAYEFVDFLKKSGQKYWQVLPLGPTSFGDSPYQTFSAFAGSPYFIDLRVLTKEGLLKKEEYDHIVWETQPNVVDYKIQYDNRILILQIAYQRFLQSNKKQYDDFIKTNASWLKDYAFFMALKYEFNGSDWSNWRQEIKQREHNAMEYYQEKLANDIGFWCFVQFKFYEQWQALKNYANQNGISIIGDMAIYVAYDSSDVWANSEFFQLDENKQPIEVAGVPGDDFAKEGQLWGNPLYNWDLMKKQQYSWWVDRVYYAKELYDIIRIDHFRGFESYFAVKFGAPNAINGIWRKGPDVDLFHTIKQKLGDVKIIAEDLGFITPEVHLMLSQAGYPGMKVMQFAFDGRPQNEYLPHNYNNNCVVYTSTHDSDTIEGWFKGIRGNQLNYVYRYLNIANESSRVWKFIESAWASVADLAMCQLQDILELDNTARMNTPSTVGINWIWRAKKEYFDETIAQKLKDITLFYNR